MGGGYKLPPLSTFCNNHDELPISGTQVNIYVYFKKIKKTIGNLVNSLFLLFMFDKTVFLCSKKQGYSKEADIGVLYLCH